MQSDTALIEQVRNFMTNKPNATAYDVVNSFKQIGVSEEKVLYILREMFN